jgi:hypothetical protein
MPVVLLVLLLVGTSMTVLILHIVNETASTASMVGRRQAFYTCDGIARAAVDLSHSYLRTTAVPNSTDLRAAICTAAGGCTTALIPDLTPTGFEVEDFQVALVGARSPGTVPTGPFTGMNATVDQFQLSVIARKQATGDRCSVQQVVSSADVSLFQFFAWADGFLDIYPAPVMSVSGRTHVNGDFCAGSMSNRLSLDRLTASGHVYSGTNCPRYNQSTGAYFVGDATHDGLTSTKQVDGTTDSVGKASTWKTFAPANWGGKLADGGTGVTELKFPIAGTPRVQDGYRAPANATSLIANNKGSVRFIVDPPTTSDDSTVRVQRYACKADLRIINGVWYKKPLNPADGCGFPGIPIWSDHPGHYTVTESAEGGNAAAADAMFVGTTNVGQEDLSSSWSGTIPRKFSYYEYDATNKKIFDNTTGVVSYGALFKSGSATTSTWRPGLWVFKESATFGSAAADGYSVSTDFTSSTTFSSVTFDDNHFCPFSTSTGTAQPTSATIVDATTTSCFTGTGATKTAIDRGSVLLAATRAGFRDTRAMNVDDTADEMLPLNFDVAAFADAMATNSGNELGSYFGGGATFNGIVYIGLTWPNSRTGMGNNGGATLAGLWPRNGAESTRDVNQVTTAFSKTTRTAQRGLPYPLCTQTVGGVAPPTTGPNPAGRIPFSGGNGNTSLFSIPPCTNATDVNTSRPNAVRIINARSLTAGTFTFPKGLSIVTNAPLYLQGDFNAGSATAANWRPAMVGGDAMTFLSNDWSDVNSPWNDGTGVAIGSRAATNTTYYLAAVAGDVQTSTNGACTGNCWSGGLNNFPRFMEKWSASSGGGAPEITAKINGSFVIGFRSVYARQPWNLTGTDAAYYPPLRDWDFDTNFDVPINQPPGTPQFSIDAVRTWRRQ